MLADSCGHESIESLQLLLSAVARHGFLAIQADLAVTGYRAGALATSHWLGLNTLLTLINRNNWLTD